MSSSTAIQNIPMTAEASDRASPATPNLRRRGFLLGVGASGVGVAAALALKPAATTLVPSPDEAADHGSGYRATKHVQNYYRTAKI